jgi:hypothetical protein
MPAKILESNKVAGGADAGPRNIFLSWVPTVHGADRKGPKRCADAFLAKLKPVPRDSLGRKLTVVASQPEQQQAGTRTVGWGDFDCTDFVALVTSEYAAASDFAQAVAAMDCNGKSLALWTAIIEACPWRLFSVGGERVLGELPLRHPLLPDPKDEVIATAPPIRLDRHMGSVVGQLLGHDPGQCPHCAPP